MIAPAPFLVAPHPVPGESDDATETPRPGLGGTPSLVDEERRLRQIGGAG